MTALTADMLKQCEQDSSARKVLEAVLGAAIENELRAPPTEAFRGLGPVQRLRMRMGMRRMIARGRLPTELLAYMQSQRTFLDTAADDAGRNTQLSSLSKELAAARPSRGAFVLALGCGPGARIAARPRRCGRDCQDGAKK